MTGVFEAVKNNDLDALRRAIPDAKPADLAGALRNAAELGRLPLVECLVQGGARDDWAIVAAASFGTAATVRYLYERVGGDVDAALIGAAAHGKEESARFLLTTPARTRDEALADAVLRGYEKIATLLLDAGADPFAPVYGGRTAAAIAREKGRDGLAALFEKARNSKPANDAESVFEKNDIKTRALSFPEIFYGYIFAVASVVGAFCGVLSGGKGAFGRSEGLKIQCIRLNFHKKRGRPAVRPSEHWNDANVFSGKMIFFPKKTGKSEKDVILFLLIRF